MTWRESSHSGAGNGDCVEVAVRVTGVVVRDCKNTAGPILAFSPTTWRGFLRSRPER